jgi:triphosphoribosyl-dephospho-CoA synthetase
MTLETIDKGFLKLNRVILDWQWYKNGNTARVMLHFLLKANFKSINWEGNTINQGQFITSLKHLSIELGMSESCIRTAIKNLIKTKYITKETTSQFTKITVLISELYKPENLVVNAPNNKPFTKESQTDNKPIATTKKEKKEIESEERKEIFKKSIFKFSSSYLQDHLESFYNYYSQENKQTGRLKFEEFPYWNLEDKLSSWKHIEPVQKKEIDFYINR